MMPGMNGLELCKKIKSNPKTAHIPVVLLTARVAAVQELEGLETGADDYIQKPFNPRILKAKVNAVLLNRNKLHQYYQRSILLQPAEIVIPDEDRNFLENAMKLVEHNLTNPDFNVQSLVSMMGMSQSVFYKRVKSITGQSVIEFIKDIRLKRAAHLLANGHARVSEIAMMVGIEDPKNFRVSFQKIYHMSPSQYAREHRQNIRDENTTE
jgi:AraC-like DNA-binding protein